VDGAQQQAQAVSGTDELRWHYGPTATDPDPGKMWCCDCGGEVMIFDDAYVCSCGRQSDG
jgi:hypothetical protein